MKKYIFPSSQITPEEIFLSRRNFFKKLAVITAGTALFSACNPKSPESIATPDNNLPGLRDELGSPATAYKDITGYTNYYEFAEDKTSPSGLAKDFKIDPWSIKVDGLVNKPTTYDIDTLKKKFDEEERVYRLRCVETWSMVIPWLGFPLKELIAQSEPSSTAKYVRFEAIFDPDHLPGQKDQFFPWPYVEGLRLDEAMHDLTLLATGIYGKDLLPQNGGPIRLVVPWKYGFKSIKAIIHIELVDKMPTSFWMSAGPGAYGFYANVNPDVSQPWPQNSETRIGETGRVKTLPFNGYAEQVASLYQVMDLNVDY
jgi:sulfoxide reductase catalytic subunit YedY